MNRQLRGNLPPNEKANGKNRFLSLLLLFMAFISVQVYAQDVKVSGTVIAEADKFPIIGANIVVKGTTIGTVTDIDGNFSLDVPQNSTIAISYIGCETQEIKITGAKTLNIVLKDNAIGLDDVVVIGYGSQRKSDLTGGIVAVGEEKLQMVTTNNLMDKLAGQIPGMNVTTSNAKPGEDQSLRVRGENSLSADNSPLIVMDGIPYSGSLGDIDPDIIENMSVLKDASSAAIYGSRAPFGVILVTTKSGEAGKATIQYSNNFRWSRPTNIPDMLDSYRFAKYFNAAQKNSGSGTTFIFTDDTIDRIQKYMAGEYPYTSDPNGSQGNNFFPFNVASNDNQNWPRNFIDKTSFGQEHNLSISGGGEKVKYYLSGAFLSQNGQMNYSDENKKRYNISGKVTGQVTKWLSLDFNARFIRSDIEMPTFVKLYGDRFFAETTKLYPMMPLYDNNGHYTRNPKLMQLTSGGRSNSSKDTYFTSGGFHLTPLKGLGIHGQATLRTESYRHQYNVNKVYLYTRDNQPVEEAWLGGDPDLAAGKTFVQSQTQQTSMMTTSLYADYEYSWNKHNFKVTAGMNTEYYYINELIGKRYDVINENVPSINTATGTSDLKGSSKEWATMGYFARLNYDYEGRYLLEGNIRRDGTSRFRGNQRWGTFPSVSIGWNIAREAFWSPAEAYVNLLKLRFSYGSLGNQNTDNYYPTYSIQNITVGSVDAGGRWLLDLANKSNIASSPGLVSSLLTWERVTSYNAGLDFGAFNNRLNGYVEYYIRDTKDMVGPAEEITPLVGASAPKMNNTSLRTKGWELQLTWQDRIGKVGYHASFNLSDAQTEVTEYPNPDKTFYTKDEDGNTIENYWKGKKLGEIWGFKTVGIAKTDEEMQSWIAQHDQSKLPNVGNNIWKAGDIMYANLDDNPAIEKGTSATCLLYTSDAADE